MRKIFNRTVVVSGLGYFVDMFDLTLFGVVRVASLKALGVTDPAELLRQGVFLFNMQMIGMLVGGVLWGVLGDKKGRLSVLYGSILLYSLANIANAFVTDVTTYGILRFIAGVGLAGELGAAITLVSETMNKEDRGYGTTVVATMGLCGSVAAAMVGKHLEWSTAYIIGGVLGILLLVSRMRVFESGMFEHVKKSAGNRMGDFRLLLSGERALRYLACMVIGIPIWFITGVLMTFSPEITAGLGIQGTVTAADALLYGSVGLALGDLGSGLLSQWLKSRKKAVLYCLAGAAVLSLVYLFNYGSPLWVFMAVCFGLGLCAGYWAVFVTIASEQFGTNIRSTVTTSVPNLVRASTVPVTLAFSALKGPLGIVQAALVVGVGCFALALVALHFLEETYGKNLDYLEGVSTTEGEAVTSPSSVSTTG